jgi:hypothetical protein
LSCAKKKRGSPAQRGQDQPGSTTGIPPKREAVSGPSAEGCCGQSPMAGRASPISSRARSAENPCRTRFSSSPRESPCGCGAKCTLPRRSQSAGGIFGRDRRGRVLPHPLVHLQRGTRFFANLIAALRKLLCDREIAVVVDFAILNCCRQTKAQIGMAQQRLERADRAVRPRLERVDDAPTLRRFRFWRPMCSAESHSLCVFTQSASSAAASRAARLSDMCYVSEQIISITIIILRLPVNTLRPQAPELCILR